jgi:hypothetical protein
VRIEDHVLVTTGGQTALSTALPIMPTELETWVRAYR